MDLREKDNKPDFISWIRVYRPTPKAPSFIKATFEIDLNQILDNINNIKKFADSEGKVRGSLKESKAGNLYTLYDTYRRDQEVKSSKHSPDREEDDIPFL